MDHSTGAAGEGCSTQLPLPRTPFPCCGCCLQLSVSAGDKLTLVDGVSPTADGWTLVRANDGREGVVPTAYLRTGPGEAGRVYPCSASARFAFEGEEDGELTVAAGDALTVIREIDGWFHARKDADGTEGLVPASYLAI